MAPQYPCETKTYKASQNLALLGLSHHLCYLPTPLFLKVPWLFYSMQKPDSAVVSFGILSLILKAGSANTSEFPVLPPSLRSLEYIHYTAACVKAATASFWSTILLSTPSTLIMPQWTFTA